MISQTVSIIIPTFNRRELLHESFASAVQQTYRPLEVVIVDDGSTDGTDEISAALVEKGRAQGVSVVWVRQENLGVSAARNRGIEESSGYFILFHDSDDLLEPDGVALQVAKLQMTGADLCARSLHRFATDGVVVSRYTPDTKTPDRMTSLEIKKMHWGTPSFMYRRSALKSLRWDECISCAEDIDFNFRVLKEGASVCLEPRAVTKIREHADAVKLLNKPGGTDAYWTVHGRMLQHYRDCGMPAHLAIEQATLLRFIVKQYAVGGRKKACFRFHWIRPLAPGVVSGGVGERLALRLGWCGLFCAIRRFNELSGHWAGLLLGRSLFGKKPAGAV